MSDLYTEMQVSPKKKRAVPDADADAYTPKKLRTALLTPPSTRKHRKSELPNHLARLLTMHTSLQNALSHALATCAVSPSESGIVRNVLNHLSLTTYTGLKQFMLDDLRRLCWVWEWNTLTLKASSKHDDEENPFLDSSPAKDWTRGSMGIVITPATHKTAGTRAQAYGLGIEVEMDLDKGTGGGMAAVARWAGACESRTAEFRNKLQKWIQLNSDINPIPHIPLAQLPTLPSNRTPLTSPFKTPNKRPTAPTPTSSPTKNSIIFPSTPSSKQDSTASLLLTPRTPSTSDASSPTVFSTPRHQRVSSSSNTPQTPTTARRQALYERVRQRSLSASPTKPNAGLLTRDQLLKMSQEETRRRCLLGRLGGVAESVWMLFSAPVTGSAASPLTRKRRALPSSEVTSSVIKSSPVPISAAEANESLEMLTQLCPFFLKKLNIGGEEWLEMPAPISAESGSEVAASPLKDKDDSAQEILSRSPKRVKREEGGLRTVREIIRRELESQD